MDQPGRQDIRITRTRSAIKAAFKELAAKTPIDKISVTSITQAAGINRKTFYLHYEAIEALLDDIVSDIMDDFFENYEKTPGEPKDIEGHAYRFFLFLSKQDELTEHLVCTPSYYDFGKRMYREQMARFRAVDDPFAWMGTDKEELLLSFIRNTVFDMYRNWVQRGKKVPAEEVAELVAQLSHNSVAEFMH